MYYLRLYRNKFLKDLEHHFPALWSHKDVSYHGIGKSNKPVWSFVSHIPLNFWSQSVILHLPFLFKPSCTISCPQAFDNLFGLPDFQYVYLKINFTFTKTCVVYLLQTYLQTAIKRDNKEVIEQQSCFGNWG